MEGLPDLLTIEEAARVIRVGRTKAYAMAREWRATGGEAGLPVIDFGHALRVPLCQLEKIVGGPLTARGRTALTAVDSERAGTPAVGGTPADEAPATGPETESSPAVDAIVVPDPNDSLIRSVRRPTRRRTVAPDQPSLPFAS
jgi:hypothetical protein